MGSAAVTMLSSEPVMGRVIPATKHSMINQAEGNNVGGGTGILELRDHLENSMQIEWEDGRIITNGHQIVQYLGAV